MKGRREKSRCLGKKLPGVEGMRKRRQRKKEYEVIVFKSGHGLNENLVSDTGVLFLYVA